MNSYRPVGRPLYAAKITSYAQGMALLRLASAEYKYDIDLAEVARIWRAGCIIRAALLSDIRTAFSRNPSLVNLMLDETFSRGARAGTTGAARGRANGRRCGDTGARIELVARVLRRVSQRAAAGESHPGTAGFLWRTYISPHRSRRRLSHRVGTRMSSALQIPSKGELDFLSLGALVHRLDSGIYPFHKASTRRGFT